MDRIDAPDIRWSALAEETDADHDHEDAGDYDLADFKRAVVGGVHPDGSPLSSDMPRWRISDQALRDLADYLASLE